MTPKELLSMRDLVNQISATPWFWRTKQRIQKVREVIWMVISGCAQKRLYSIKELVKEVGATEWFWRTQIWDGQLPYVQVGRKMLIDRNDIEAFIKKHKSAN